MVFRISAEVVTRRRIHETLRTLGVDGAGTWNGVPVEGTIEPFSVRFARRNGAFVLRLRYDTGHTLDISRSRQWSRHVLIEERGIRFFGEDAELALRIAHDHALMTELASALDTSVAEVRILPGQLKVVSATIAARPSLSQLEVVIVETVRIAKLVHDALAGVHA